MDGVLGRDYDVGFEEVVEVFSGDESVPDGQGGVAGQPGVGQAVLVQGGVGGLETQVVDCVDNSKTLETLTVS